MRASMLLRSAAKKGSSPNLFPPEIYPLVVCMGFVTAWFGFRLTKNYMSDDVRAGHQQNDTARSPKAGH